MRLLARTSLFALLAAAPLLPACTVHETKVVEPNAPPPPPPPVADQPAPPPPVAAQPPPPVVVGAPPPPMAAPPPPPVAAQAAPGRHVGFHHALENLRVARFDLKEISAGGRPGVWDERGTVQMIEDTIKIIKEAGVDDGRNIDDHGTNSGSPSEPRRSRLKSAHEALTEARATIVRDEDNAFANDLKRRALYDIDKAIKDVDIGTGAEHH
jgi:hypothetical protein